MLGSSGFGFFYFNPEGKYYDGKWYKLKPLNTEGQGLAGSEGTDYSLFQFYI